MGRERSIRQRHPGSEVVDLLDGRKIVVLPGLGEGHLRITVDSSGWTNRPIASTVTPQPSIRAQEAESRLRELLGRGVTSQDDLQDERADTSPQQQEQLPQEHK